MRTKVTVSALAAVLILTHVLWPRAQVDAVVVCLVALGVLPWLDELIKSLELPGGFKIELKDVKAATDKLTQDAKESPAGGAVPTEKALGSADISSIARLGTLVAEDPNLALVGVRIEIEKSLRAIAEKEKIPISERSVTSLVRDLAQRGKLSPGVASGLRALINLGNRAAHGAGVSREAAEWALDSAPAVLVMLNPPHVAFLKLCEKLDALLLRYFPDKAGSLWHQGNSKSVLDMLQDNALLSSAERSQLEDFLTLRADIRFGLGDWYEGAAQKLSLLGQLYETLAQRLGEHAKHAGG